MSTEEFVLILRHIFIQEQQQVSAFLYALLQTLSPLTAIYYHILYHLIIPTQFTCNKYAKKFLELLEKQNKKLEKNLRTRNRMLLSREQKNQRLLVLMRKAMQTRKKNSHQRETEKLFLDEKKT